MGVSSPLRRSRLKTDPLALSTSARFAARNALNPGSSFGSRGSTFSIMVEARVESTPERSLGPTPLGASHLQALIGPSHLPGPT